MRQRRVILTVLTAVLIMISVSFTAHAEEGGVGTYTGEGGAFELVSGDSLNFHFTCKLDFDWFVYGDNTMYLSDLGQFAVTAANAIYVSGTSAASGNIPGGGTSFFTAVGFDAAESITVASETGYDKNDFTGFIAAHKKVEREGKTYEIIFITLRGSLTTEEWQSNFDIGADTETYYSVTGEHPEWLDSQKCMHKGFAVTANRVMKAIAEYEARVLDPEAEKIIMLTGHSRGASVANILGKYYEEDTETYYKTFTYTVACSGTTTESAEVTSKYKTVFNLVNEDDLVPRIPTAEWGGFRRYGRDLSVSASQYKDVFKSISDCTYGSANGATLAAALAPIASDRASLYEIDYTSKGYTVKGTYLTSTFANLAYNNLSSTLNSDGIMNLVDLRKESKKVYFYCRPVYLFHVFAKFLTSDDYLSMATILASYPLSDTYESILNTVSNSFLDDSFGLSHYPNAYYCIAANDFGYAQEEFMPPATALEALERLIRKLGEAEYTKEFFGKLSECLRLYGELTVEEQAAVTEYAVLEEAESAFLELEAAAETFCVVVNSRMEGGSLSVAFLIGGGEYYTIRGGDVTAPTDLEGLVFKGWYEDFSEEAPGELISSEATIHVQPEEDMDLTAVYVPEEEVTFRVSIDAERYYVSCEIGPQEGLREFSVTPGTALTVVYLSPDHGLESWIDEEGIIRGTCRNITFAVTRDMTLTAVPDEGAPEAEFILIEPAESEEKNE